jgi:uncharacterized protein (TIGR02246 family)
MIKMDSSKLLLIALRFNERINLQDAEGLAELMTEDHTFINSKGNVTKGKDKMKEDWKNFFKTYPDYRNHITHATLQDDTVILIGHSTCSQKPLNGPNIWTAKIKTCKVKEWTVQWLNKR